MSVTPVFTAIKERRSTGKLTTPPPDKMTIVKMLQAAESAPDHGRLKPWRIHIVQGEALKHLGEVFAKASFVDPNDPRRVEKAKQMPLRAPMIFVVSVRVSKNKIPEIEQHIASGVAVQNMQLVAHEFGFATMWRTGDVAYDPAVKATFGLLETDQIVGFLYAGTPEAELPARDEAELVKGMKERVFHWRGPSDIIDYGAD